MSNNAVTSRLRAALLCGCVGLAGLASDAGAGSGFEAITDSEPSDGPPKDAAPPRALEAPGPKDLHVESVSTGGAGCPTPDTITPIVAADGSSFLLIFDVMQLEYPPGPLTQTLTCSAGIELQIPDGWKLALGTVNTRGYAYLDKQIRARASSRYFIAGDPIAYRPHAVINGPFDDLYDFTDKIPFGSVVWSACGGSAIFTVQTILKLDARKNPEGQAIFSTDTVDGSFQQLYHWKWKKC